MDDLIESTETRTSRVQDLYLASYLHCLGYSLCRIEGVKPHSKFFFSDVPEGKEFDYYNGVTEQVSPRDFFESFKAMRNLSSHVETLSQGFLSVRDIYLASYLYYKEYKIVHLEETPYQFRFTFEQVPMDVVIEFYNGSKVELQVKRLMQSFRNVRDLSAYTNREEHSA